MTIEEPLHNQRLRGLLLKYRKAKSQGYRMDEFHLDWEMVEQDLINVITDDYQTTYPDKVKRVYISGMITGIETIAPELFARAEEKLKGMGYYTVNPMTLPHLHDKTWLNFMREDLKALCDCDAIYVMSNYTFSKGATIEVELATKLGLEVIYEGVTSPNPSVGYQLQP